MGRYDILTNLENKPKDSPSAPSGEDNNAKTDLPANQQTGKSVNQQTSKEPNPLTSKSVNQQTNKDTNQQADKPVNLHAGPVPLSTKEKKKYSTYLREESILEIQILAARTRQKDHELLQEIVDYYFKSTKN